MARVALPIVGAVAGFFIGGPTGAQYGWLAGSVAGALVGSQTRRSVRVNETGAQTTTEGAPRAIVYGAAIVTGNLIDTGPIRIVETTEEAKGGSGPSSTTRSYFRTYAIRVCEGPIAAYLMIKRDGKVVYDVREGANFQAANDIFTGYTARYLGTESQMPDPDLEAIHGVGEVPAYRGSAYVVFTDDNLTARQGSVPQWEFLVTTEANEADVALAPITSLTVGGQFGGGTFTDFSTSTTFDAVGSGGITGTAFLASFWFEGHSIGGPWTPTVFLRIGGVTVWTAPISVASLAEDFASVQINHALDGVEVELGWTGSFSGQFSLGLQGLPGGYAPLTPHPPGGHVLVESTDDDFGVVRDSGGNWGAARYTISGNQLWRDDLTYSPGTLTPGTVVLGDIVEDIHARCSASVPDVTELDDEVHGLVLGSADYTGADAIETLRAPYMFDRAEYDGQIHYPKRGAAAAATVTFDDLVEVPDETQREAHPEYPRKLHLMYQAVQVNYEMAQATSDRYSTDTRVTGEQSLQVPVVLDEEAAQNICTRLHKIAWSDADGEVEFSLPLSWVGLTPSECLNLDLRDRLRRLRIERIDRDGGVLALTSRVDRQTNYTSEAASFIPLPTPARPPTIDPGDTTLAVMDIGALRDVDDILLRYVAVSSTATSWTGATTQRSLDDGATFTSVQTLTQAAVVGTLVNAVAAASEHYTDTTNTVRVQLIRSGQEITSISDLAFVQRGGAFALAKADGSWEVMQYLDATDEGDGVFLLSTLHRGLLNSGASAHSAGALFVLLSGARVEAAESAWIGQDIVSRAPSIGQSPEDADEQTATYVGRSQTEWPVVNLDVERDGSDNIIATWVPRHRLGTDVAPVASVNFTGYRVTLDDGADEVTFDTTDAEFTYDASALADPLTVTVQALNRFTGAGPATTSDPV